MEGGGKYTIYIPGFGSRFNFDLSLEKDIFMFWIMLMGIRIRIWIRIRLKYQDSANFQIICLNNGESESLTASKTGWLCTTGNTQLCWFNPFIYHPSIHPSIHPLIHCIFRSLWGRLDPAFLPDERSLPRRSVHRGQLARSLHKGMKIVGMSITTPPSPPQRRHFDPILPTCWIWRGTVFLGLKGCKFQHCQMFKGALPSSFF